MLSIFALALTVSAFPPQRPLHVKTDTYEVTAPDSTTLREGIAGVERARRAFTRFVGEPPRTALVLVNTEEERQSVDRRIYADSGIALLVWSARRDDQGARGASGASPASLESVVAHELVHQISRLRFGSTPPWFNEGFASLCETPEVREVRTGVVHAHLAELIPLPELFRMAHPMTTALRGAGPSREGEVVSPPSPEDMERVYLFYGQSMALLEFLREREGDRFIGTFAEALSRTGRAAEGLRLAKRVPQETAALELEFRKWVAGHMN